MIHEILLALLGKTGSIIIKKSLFARDDIEDMSDYEPDEE